MLPHVFVRFTVTVLFGSSRAVVVPKHEPRDFPVANSTTRVVDNTTIYYPGPVDLRRVRSGPIPVPAAVSEDGTSVTTENDLHKYEGKEVLRRTGPREEGKKETPTNTFNTPLPTGYVMTPARDVLLRKIIDMVEVKRGENDTKEGEQSCPCPCQCPAMEGPKKKKKKLSKGAIAGIVIGSVVVAAILLYGALLWLVEKFFNW